MNLSAHSLWLVGFRPFFSLAFLSGLGLPVVWVLLFSGAIPAPPASFSIIRCFDLYQEAGSKTC